MRNKPGAISRACLRAFTASVLPICWITCSVAPGAVSNSNLRAAPQKNSGAKLERKGKGPVADATDLASVRQVLQEHREQIIRDYHAVGVGVGAKDGSSGEYAIVVYLKSERDVPP